MITEVRGVKAKTPCGTIKYGTIVFQVVDVPAGDFEIIITKEI